MPQIHSTQWLFLDHWSLLLGPPEAEMRHELMAVGDRIANA
jgi:hypothetical protein